MKKFISLILVYSICLLLMACPKETAVRKAAKASFELSGLTVDAIAATAKAYNENLIGLETKDKIADALKLVATGGKNFNQALKKFRDQSGDNLTPDQISFLNVIFSSEVITPFLGILQTLKVLSMNGAKNLLAAINALKVVILLISNGFASAGIPQMNFREVEVNV